MATQAVKIALLGAESTGKTQLSVDLAIALRARGKRVTVVAEVLRKWCQREGRTPRPDEQMPIAQEQEKRVDDAIAHSDIVISDTTSLMVAIYSGMLFNDGILYQFALERLARYNATLLAGLDLPWVADGLQRDGPHVREPVDALIRTALASAGLPYRVIYGHGQERLAHALAAIDGLVGDGPVNQVSADSTAPTATARPWKWLCDKCTDPDCEHRLFTGTSRADPPP